MGILLSRFDSPQPSELVQVPTNKWKVGLRLNQEIMFGWSEVRNPDKKRFSDARDTVTM